MTLAMEPMKVNLRVSDAVLGRKHVATNPTLSLETQAVNANLALYNARLVQENLLLMQNYQQVATALQGVQLARAWAGPPGLTMEPHHNPLWQLTASPRGLTKEPSSDHSDSSTTCSLCDEVSSTHGASETSNEKQFTQVIIRNLRSDFTRGKLLNFLEVVGYKGKYDMVYLPTSFDTGKCYQYGFVSFLSEEIAQQFATELQGFTDEDAFGELRCEISWSDWQGLPDLIEKYRNSPMMHPSVPDECKPLLFVDGHPVAFPAPTKNISKPRLNRRTR